MIEGVFEGNEWRYIDNDEVIASRGKPAASLRRLTRAQAQARLDDLYGTGRITREQWSARFDVVSEPSVRHYDALCAFP